MSPLAGSGTRQSDINRTFVFGFFSMLYAIAVIKIWLGIEVNKE